MEAAPGEDLGRRGQDLRVPRFDRHAEPPTERSFG
jgi:hypothetical protein